MTTHDQFDPVNMPAVLTPEEQRAVWFLGALIQIRVGGGSAWGGLAIREHAGPRGYSSPLHCHEADEETFFILDGDVRVEVGGRAVTAVPGTAAAHSPFETPPDELLPDPAALAAIAASYGIEILGPSPSPS